MGYTVSNVVEVRLDDLRKIGQVIDAATQAGSNDVQGIRFALRDEEAPRTEALREAALSARQDAETLAGALGLRVVGVLSVTEQSPDVTPMPIYPQGAVRPMAARGPHPGRDGHDRRQRHRHPGSGSRPRQALVCLPTGTPNVPRFRR